MLGAAFSFLRVMILPETCRFRLNTGITPGVP